MKKTIAFSLALAAGPAFAATPALDQLKASAPPDAALAAPATPQTRSSDGDAAALKGAPASALDGVYRARGVDAKTVVRSISPGRIRFKVEASFRGPLHDGGGPSCELDGEAALSNGIYKHVERFTSIIGRQKRVCEFILSFDGKTLKIEDKQDRCAEIDCGAGAAFNVIPRMTKN